MKNSFKVSIHKHCLNLVQEKLNRIQLALNEASESLLSASKSTAGDKHETSRAMIHLEQEKLGVQMLEQQKAYAGLDQLDPEVTYSSIQKGSLIQTDKGLFYLSESIGAIEVDDQKVFVLSPASPIGTLFMGKQEGDSLTFRDQTYCVKLLS